MIEIRVTRSVPASAAEVWGMLRTFEGIERFVDVVESSEVRGEGVGAIRTCVLQGGERMVERLESLDDASRTLTWALRESFLPVADFEATLTVTPDDGDACTVAWTGTFEASPDIADEASETLRGLYQECLDGLHMLYAAA